MDPHFLRSDSISVTQTQKLIIQSLCVSNENQINKLGEIMIGKISTLKLYQKTVLRPEAKPKAGVKLSSHVWIFQFKVKPVPFPFHLICLQTVLWVFALQIHSCATLHHQLFVINRYSRIPLTRPLMASLWKRSMHQRTFEMLSQSTACSIWIHQIMSLIRKTLRITLYHVFVANESSFPESIALTNGSIRVFGIVINSYLKIMTQDVSSTMK